MVAAGDQAIKALVGHFLQAGATVTVIPHVLRLSYVRNTGVAFGLLPGFSPLVGAMAALTLFFVLFYNRGRWPGSRAEHAGIALMAGGAAGNLCDRVRLGFVVDYLDLHVWPVFNAADAAIVVGAGILALTVARPGAPRQSRR